MANIARFSGPLWDLDTHYVFEDFEGDQSDTTWIDTVTDLGTVTYEDLMSGVALLDPSDGTVADNDEAYLHQAGETFLIAAGKPMYFRTRIHFSEKNTDDANILVGWANAPAANLIIDDGGGPRASGTIICVEKRDGETEYRLTTRNGSNVTSTLSRATEGAAGFTEASGTEPSDSGQLSSGSWQVIEIFVEDSGLSTECYITAKVNGRFLFDTNGSIIRHTRLVASATEMSLVLGVKNGSANNELLYCDYIYGHQQRRGVNPHT